MTTYRSAWISLLMVLLLTACASGGQAIYTPSTPAAGAPDAETPDKFESPGEAITGKLVIYSGRSEPLIQPVIEAFELAHPQVEVLLKAGSNSELANALIEEQPNPQADVFITTELFTVQSLAEQGVFQPYQPEGSDQLPAEFIDPQNRWVGLTRRARVIMYNSELVKPEDLPRSIFDLVDPKWKGQVAAAGSTNGSMQAQIAAMRQLLGEKATEEWLQGLIDNQVTFFGGHTDVRKAVGAGEFKLGLVNHYYFYLQQAEGSPVGIIFPDQGEGQIGLITNASAAAIVRGAGNPSAAQAFLDYLVSREGQEIFAKLNYEYPLLPAAAALPELEPLEGFRLAEVEPAKAALEFKATFDLMERLGLP
ncbi:MAG: ABC transporter substrate-binding protein [Chloroflexi bacterium RBG_16_54_18]|nr:MAG: ABC transporter substrate-binding protein [Chloroflexi bacterium RBG_16_54_18]